MISAVSLVVVPTCFDETTVIVSDVSSCSSLLEEEGGGVVNLVHKFILVELLQVCFHKANM